MMAMASSTAGDATPLSGLDPHLPFVVQPVEVAHVVVPLDGSSVAEPAPHWYFEGARPRQARGPAEPERYVESLVARAEGAGVAVAARVIYDPISVSDGLVPVLDRTAALVIVGSRDRQGLGRMVLGCHAVRIVHDAAVPALVVPLPDA
jgi:nucleotide-binding universal stress UspA family protein